MSDRARQLHQQSQTGVFLVTGGGSSFVDELLQTPGASRTVLEASVPYAESALQGWLGGPPEQSCSADTVRALAMAAFERARRLDANARFGFACTASLATDRPKRGEHRAYVAVQTAEVTRCAKLTLEKGARDRSGEEAVLRDFCWQQLLSTLDESHSSDSSESALWQRSGEPAWQALVLGERTQQLHGGDHDGRLLLPGSFNPLHEGHRQMLDVAESQTGLAGAYELSVENVDKPMLDYIEIDERLNQFDRPVWLTRLPTFTAKAEQFPGATFAVGIDTMSRIADSRYYPGGDSESAFRQLADRQTRFLVFGRASTEGYKTLADLALPATLAALCEAVPESAFRLDISSTELRRAARTE